MKLKICGMREKDNIIEVARLQPDYMGFIFFKGSKRYVGEDFRIPDGLPGSIRRVGVFVNESFDKILELKERHHLNYAQLHGDETESDCASLISHLNVIKAFRIHDRFDFDQLKKYEDVVDYFLFDASGPGYGGNGRLFDWSLLENYSLDVPFFLSGGISPDIIGKLVGLKGLNINAIDVNSGIEDSPGVKNIELVREIKEKLKML